MLLLLDDEKRELRPSTRPVGAVRLGWRSPDGNWHWKNRIDTDLDKLTLVDSTPLQDSLIDPMLKRHCRGD